MSLRILGQLRRTADYVLQSWRPGCAILLYHHIAEKLSADPFSQCVSTHHFAEHLQILSKLGKPVSIHQLAESLRQRKSVEGAIAVTFDDGYADIATLARPLLERYNVPATVFVVAGCVDSGSEFWWDELEQLLLLPGTLPRKLRLSFQGKVREWELNEDANYPVNLAQKHQGWRFYDADEPTVRHRLYRELYVWLRELRQCNQRELLALLWQWAGRKAVCRSSHRPLTSEELRGLTNAGIVEIGSHTMTHADLSHLSPLEQAVEISSGKSHLEESCRQNITAFAYPYGLYQPTTIVAVQQAGFVSACSCNENLVSIGTDLFQLPRLAITDCDGPALTRRLRRWASWRA